MPTHSETALQLAQIEKSLLEGAQAAKVQADAKAYAAAGGIQTILQTYGDVAAKLDALEGSQPAPIPPVDSAGPWAVIGGPGQGISKSPSWSDDTDWIPKGTLVDERDGQIIVCAARSGIHSESYGDTPELRWRRVIHLPGAVRCAHGGRLYGIRGELTDCAWHGIGKGEDPDQLVELAIDGITDDDSFGGQKDGHGFYASPGGDLRIIRGTFRDCDGQGVQLRNKAVSAYVPPDQLEILVRQSSFIDNATNESGSGGGGATHLAIYCGTPKGTEVYLYDNIFQSTAPALQYSPLGDRKVRGCAAIWNEQGGHFSRVELLDNMVLTEGSDRNLFTFQGVKDLYVRNLAIAYINGIALKPGKAVLNIVEGGVPLQKASIQACQGEGDIIYKGQKVADLEDGWEYSA